jgi:acyl carrier protein
MNEVAERVRDFVLEHGEWYGSREELTGEVPLLNNALDSIGVADLVAMLESEFAIEVGDDDLDPANFATIDVVAAFVVRKQTS